MSSSISRDRIHDRSIEWLEPDGFGGFASGTPSGERTRRYHGLLSAAQEPPIGRVMLVNAVEASIEIDGGAPCALSTHRYASGERHGSGVLHPDGASRIVAFTADPMPKWTFEVEGGLRVEHELFVVPGSARVILVWRATHAAGSVPPSVRLTVRPLLSGRDLHALHHENAAFRFEPDVDASACSVRWQPYADLPAIRARSNGAYRHEPLWYRRFLYLEERARGYDHLEDLAAPGVFEFDLAHGEAVLVLGAETSYSAGAPTGAAVDVIVRDLHAGERASRESRAAIDRAADAYVVRRGEGLTILAGYPWFTDWGRDTFVSLRGLLLARGRHAEARSILVSWAQLLSHGMLPNRFPERDAAEFNSVDASLWFAVAVHELLQAADAGTVSASDRRALEHAVIEILQHYSRGTRLGIRADDDGLLACGAPGVQLTWMDAKVGGEVITPRIGKPVEIQALWINALAIGARIDARWKPAEEKARASFERVFWNEELGALYDVVDEDHVAEKVDATLRPNQILAVGGLPFPVVSGARARSIVDVVERELVTPLGLRTLPAGDARYVGLYRGDAERRDRAYHQGTVWPWLLGPFVEAWVRVRGSNARARRAARERFLPPLLEHLAHAGWSHVSELADGDAPHAPGGCPFQAWSMGELVRLDRAVLAESPARTRARSRTTALRMPA